jgi:hypothetical protein
MEKQIIGEAKKGFAYCITARTRCSLFSPYEIIILLPILLLSYLRGLEHPCPAQHHPDHGG